MARFWNFERSLAVASTTLGLGAAAYANRASQSAVPLLADLTPLVDAVADCGAALYRSAALIMPVGRWLALALALLVGFGRRGGQARERAGIVAAFALAVGAQSFLMEESLWIGAFLYTAAFFLYLALPEAPAETPTHRDPRGDTLLGCAVVAGFLLLGLFALDVAPPVYYDEIGYGIAARMQGGSIEPGPVLIYPFERFQAQMAPLSLHTAALAVLEPRIVSLRLVSLAAGTLTLVGFAGLMRRYAGSRVALLALALASVSALHLIYSRAGLYIGISVAHSVVSAVALLALLHDWNARRAAWLGVCLGGSLFFYQLSWFVPILAGLVLIVSWDRWRTPGTARVAASLAAASIGMASLGPLLVPDGLAAVASQTFDYRALWNQGEGAADTSSPSQLAVPPADLGPAEIVRAQRELAASGVAVQRLEHNRRVSLLLEGDADALAGSLRSLAADGWNLVEINGRDSGPAQRLRGVVARLFYAPGPESNFRHVDGPILNPLLAPLLILGFAHALRSWRNPTLRVLLVWSGVGLILPSLLGGVLPRRCVLAIPFIYGLMALPLLRFARVFRGDGPRRFAPAAIVAVVYTLAACTGVYATYRLWEAPLPAEIPSRLRLSKIFNGLPPNRPVFMPRLYREMGVFHVQFEGRSLGPRPAALRVLGQPHPPERRIRNITCASEPPLTWIALERPEERIRYGHLREDFELRMETTDGYLITRVEARRPGGCAP